MKIPAAFIARNLRPARCSPLRLAAMLPLATADRIVATAAATPGLVSPETYLLAVAIVVADAWNSRAAFARDVAREIDRAARETQARIVCEWVRARVLAGGGAPWRPVPNASRRSWHGLDTAGAIEGGRVTWIEGEPDTI